MLRLSALLFIVVAGLVTAAGVKGREDYMTKLPLYRTYRCTLCHRSPSPISGADLNRFGSDFKANGHVWNQALAQKDSDGDGFPNGVELGDENGDGIAEITTERSNPGDAVNTPNSVDRATWGLLKSLFEG